MRMPIEQPAARSDRAGHRAVANHVHVEGLSPQGCNLFRCASAVARCVAQPDPVRCILDIAPNCLDCIPH